MRRIAVLFLALCAGIGILSAIPAGAEEHSATVQCSGIGGQDMATATIEADGIIVEIEFMCVNVEADIEVTVESGPSAAVANSIGPAIISRGIRLRELGAVMSPLGFKDIDEEYIPINGDFPKTLEEVIKFGERGRAISMLTRRYRFLVD